MRRVLPIQTALPIVFLLTSNALNATLRLIAPSTAADVLAHNTSST